MENISRKLTIGGILFVALALLIFFFLQKFDKEKEYLILGVPYYGYYSGTELSGDAESAVAMILRYWGDNRLTFLEIKKQFLPIVSHSLDEARIFFEGQNYDIDIVNFKSISKIENFLESNKKIPLLVGMLPSNTDKGDYPPYAVIIGAHYSKKGENWLIIHNSFLGNNYIVKEKFITFPLSALAIKPGEKIVSIVAGPKPSDYPARLAIMDDNDFKEVRKLGNKIYSLFIKFQKERGGLDDVKNGSSLTYIWRGAALSDEEYEELLALCEDLISLPGFLKGNTAGQMLSYDYTGRFALALKKYDPAISYFKKAADLNRDLNKPSNGWPRDPSVHWERYAFPWLHLGMAYEAKGNFKAAENSYLEALKTLDLQTLKSEAEKKADRATFENLVKRVRAKQ